LAVEALRQNVLMEDITMPDNTPTRQQRVAQIIEALRTSGHKLKDEDLLQMQRTTEALVRAEADEDHDHSHPSPPPEEE
jgi:hypothetical protein